MIDKQTYDDIVVNIKQVLEDYVAPAVAGHLSLIHI